MVVQHCEKLSISYQAQPKERWSVIERLGTMNGGLNSGITKVVAKAAPKTVFIEKRFNATQFKHKVPYREIQMLYQVSDYANIAKMVDHFLDESTQSAAVYLEFCDLGSLDVVVEQVADGKHVHEHKVWNWLIQLTEAVAYLHRGPDPSMSDDELLQSGWSRMFHRDIKPANILLTTENGQIVAKLADFGCAISEDYLALESDEDYAITQSVWTNGFDPPEHPFFSGASDIWQLGISMMSLCTGNLRPRSGNNPEGESWSISRPAGSRYSTELSWCVRWCLEKDRKARPTVRQVSNSVTTEYDQKMAMKLPFDEFPLEIFDRFDGQGRQLSQLASLPENAQAIPTPVRAPASHPVNIQQQGFDQHPNLGPRAGIIGYPASDYGYPVPQARFRIGMGNLYPSPYESDDDEYYYDPRTPQGFNPRYDPRRRNF
jgi:serine/threonine protein kinase